MDLTNSPRGSVVPIPIKYVQLGNLMLPPAPPLPPGYENLKPTIQLTIQTPKMTVKIRTQADVTVRGFVKKLKLRIPGDTSNYKLYSSKMMKIELFD